MRENLTKSDIAIGVFTSSLNLSARALSVDSTWLNDFPLAFLIGGHHIDPTLKMISAGAAVGEDYQSATKKQFLGLKALIDTYPEALWFYVTGCDAFLYSDNLLKALSCFSPDLDYFVGGHCNKITINGSDLIYPSGGPGFAISRSLALKISPFLASMCSDWESTQNFYRSACDAAISFYLRDQFGVTVSYLPGFYACPPYKYPGNSFFDGNGDVVSMSIVEEPIAFHYLSIREMYLLYCYGSIVSPDLFDRLFDRLIYILSWRLKLKSLPNYLCSTLYLGLAGLPPSFLCGNLRHYSLLRRSLIPGP